MLERIPVSHNLPGVRKGAKGYRSQQILFTDCDHVVHAGFFVIGYNTGFYDFSICTEEDPMGGFYQTSDVLAWMDMPDGYEGGLNQHD